MPEGSLLEGIHHHFFHKGQLKVEELNCLVDNIFIALYVGLVIYFTEILLFQHQEEDTSPPAIPGSKTLPKNQAKIPKPEKYEAIQKQQTRMNFR